MKQLASVGLPRIRCLGIVSILISLISTRWLELFAEDQAARPKATLWSWWPSCGQLGSARKCFHEICRYNRWWVCRDEKEPRSHRLACPYLVLCLYCCALQYAFAGNTNRELIILVPSLWARDKVRLKRLSGRVADEDVLLGEELFQSIIRRRQKYSFG